MNEPVANLLATGFIDITIVRPAKRGNRKGHKALS